MKRVLAYAGIFLALAAGVAPAQDAGRPTAPAAKYEALLKEHEKAPKDLANAANAEERARTQARLVKLPVAFLELAKENPGDPVAVDALTQTVALVNGSAFAAGDKNNPGEIALAPLQRDYVTSEKLGPVCQHALFGFHQSRETFLRAVMEKNPHADVQGLACLSLAQFLSARLNRLQLLEKQPELAERYYRVFGKDYIEQLQRQDHTAVLMKMETLFDRAAEKFSGVKIPVTYYGSGGTVGDKARVELFQIRHLAVGKDAPEIEGTDQDGTRFKLSEYRGKVVLLDFWNRL